MAFVRRNISYSAEGRQIVRTSRVEDDLVKVGRDPDSDIRLNELAVALKASKGSISQDTRTLERLGALERVTRPGDRRVYYHLGDRMMERMIALRLERFEQLREALDDVMREGAGENEAVRERLREFIGFHDYLLAKIRSARDEWCRQNAGAE